MPNTYLQSAALAADPAVAATTIALAYAGAVTPASLLVAGILSLDDPSTFTLSVADQINGAWTEVPFGKVHDGTVSGESLWLFYRQNTGAGTPTVTATYSGSASRRRIAIGEYAGLALSGALDVSVGQFEAATAGTDAMTTGAASCLANELLIGVGGFFTGGAAPAAGTGFTQRQAAQDSSGFGYIVLEDLLDSGAAGNKAATWTGSIPAIMLMGAFKSAGGGGAPNLIVQPSANELRPFNMQRGRR